MKKLTCKKILYLVCMAFSVFSTKAILATESLASQLAAQGVTTPPQRIVSLCGPGTEILATLNFKPVGYAVLNSGKIPHYWGDFLKNTMPVGSVANPSLERIKMLAPDLILIDRVYENQSDYIKNLKKIAPVLDIRATNLDDTLNHLHFFAELLQKSKEEEKYKNDLDKVSDSVKKRLSKDRVLGIFTSSKSMWAWTEESYLASVLNIANIPYAHVGQGSKYYSDMIQFSVEKILKVNPDVLFIFEEKNKNSLDFLSQSAAWKYLNAVKNNKVYQFDRDIWSRSKGPLSALVMLQQLQDQYR